jgi:hypothetical protein
MYLNYEPTYKLADLPAPPKEIIDEIMSVVATHDHIEGQSHLIDETYDNSLNERFEEIQKYKNIDWKKSLGLPFKEIEKYDDDPCYFVCLELNTPKILNWISSNIKYKIDTASVILMYGGSKILPHHDWYGYQLNYVIECNDDSYNCLYEPKEEFKQLRPNPISFVPYERLNVIKSEHLKKNKWYFFPSDKIHSVENIKGRRIVFSLIIDADFIL